MFFVIPRLYGTVTAKHPLHYRAVGNLFFRVFEGGCYYRFLMIAFRKYLKTRVVCTFFVAAFPTSLVFSVFGQCCVSESLKILSAEIGSVPVSCVVASLTFCSILSTGTSSCSFPQIRGNFFFDVLRAPCDLGQKKPSFSLPKFKAPQRTVVCSLSTEALVTCSPSRR